MADLSGSWLGTYWQQGVPTRFEATLVQSRNALSGNILDDGLLGEAQVSGEVAGRSVQFTKRYLTSPYTITYTGTLAEGEDFMSGQWRISRFNAGPWEAYRVGEDLMASLRTRLEAQEPLVVGT